MPTIANAAKANNIPIKMLVDKLTKSYPDRKWENATELPEGFDVGALQQPAPEQVQHLQVEGKLTKAEATKILKSESLAASIVSAVRKVELAVANLEGQAQGYELIAAINDGKTSVLEAWHKSQLEGLEGQFSGIQNRMQSLIGSAQDLLSAKVQAGEAGKELLSQIREFTI